MGRLMRRRLGFRCRCGCWRCCRLRDAALSRNVRVRFLFDEIAKLGCDVGSPFGFVRCASVERSGPLGDKMVGGFAVNDGSQKRYAPSVVVVAEHAPDKAVFERTLVHESRPASSCVDGV